MKELPCDHPEEYQAGQIDDRDVGFVVCVLCAEERDALTPKGKAFMAAARQKVLDRQREEALG